MSIFLKMFFYGFQRYAMETAQGPGGGGADALREAIDAVRSASL